MPVASYARPAAGPVRVAFVGQRTYAEASTQVAPARGLHPAFVDFRAGADIDPVLDALAAFTPHAVVCFRPQCLPAGAFADLRVPVLGVLTEPLPVPGEPADPDLAYNLAELRRADAANVDRVITTDPASWETAAALLPLWRAMPLPVADTLYRAPRTASRPPRVVFIGYSTMDRESALVGLKHEFGLRHYAHGLLGDELREVLHDADAGIVLRGNRRVLAFETALLPYLAAGVLAFSEPVRPRFGLEPGLDFVQVADPDELAVRVRQLHRHPDLFERVRIRGHHASRQFAASRVWPAVISDLFEDLRVFGTTRAPRPVSRAGGGDTAPRTLEA